MRRSGGAGGAAAALGRGVGERAEPAAVSAGGRPHEDRAVC